ncbi:EAP30/Vps36 family-domain-containing protein [Mucor mucedo]|uniref:EAP30/Vps36 family-domain-containing protein n=1 Tax=Mucor mucedo TaxID=29922 RepID=UPI00221F49C3|nr:EAP30/Vps36 family-domain-containing protein [Mucor mucedo]KAI7881221.1 EAP30/Vps36 family-domain-containing protein [Mucor mucedo]
MKYFQPTILSSSRRPELQANESLLLQQGHVGLYEGKVKLDHYQDGVCYLTSHRIIYVDNVNPLEYSIELGLYLVKDIEAYSGFLRSSPKIIINIDTSVSIKSTMDGEASNGPVWACSICSYLNKGSSEQCELCGVKSSNATVEPVTTTETVTNGDSSVCTTCTFINHPSMIQCEMCGADLPKEIIPTVTTSTTSSLSADISVNSAQIRLSFRKGGQPAFLAKLKGAVAERQWEKKTVVPEPSVKKRGVGITAIEDRIQKSTLEATETMTDAFQDLDRLMTKATEMVGLAESISNKVSKDASNDENELSTLRTHLLNLGIASPVTRGTAGSIYHQELARELADFLAKLFKQDDIKSLTDVYCLFNRARGVALISPEDLYKASQQFESLKLPFQLRKFSSGLLVIQSLDMNDSRAASRILKHVKERGPLSAMQLAEIEKLALAVASEQLIVTERMGLICRDEGPAGLTFYENLFLVS